MFDESVFTYMSPAKRKEISLLGVKARELKRLSQEPEIYSPIPEGLQLAAMFLDFRTEIPVCNHVLMFAGGYHNRYRWMMNNHMKDGLIGWHKAVRHGANHVRPMLHESKF